MCQGFVWVSKDLQSFKEFLNNLWRTSALEPAYFERHNSLKFTNESGGYQLILAGYKTLQVQNIPGNILLLIISTYSNF